MTNFLQCHGLQPPTSPVLHYLLEFAQTHVHWIGDAIQPSHPLSSPSSLAFNLSQHQGLFSNESALCIRWPNYWSFSFSIMCQICISFSLKGHYLTGEWLSMDQGEKGFNSNFFVSIIEEAENYSWVLWRTEQRQGSWHLFSIRCTNQ